MLDKYTGRMQWFILVTFAICLLGLISFGIIATIITRNVVPLAAPTPLLLAMRPIIKYLFPSKPESNDTKSSDREPLKEKLSSVQLDRSRRESRSYKQGYSSEAGASKHRVFPKSSAGEEGLL